MPRRFVWGRTNDEVENVSGLGSMMNDLQISFSNKADDNLHISIIRPIMLANE